MSPEKEKIPFMVQKNYKYVFGDGSMDDIDPESFFNWPFAQTV